MDAGGDPARDPANPSRNAHTCVGFRLVANAVRFSAWFIPLSVTVESVHRNGCPVKARDVQNGVQTSEVVVQRKGSQGLVRDDPGFGDSGGVSRFFSQFEIARQRIVGDSP